MTLNLKKIILSTLWVLLMACNTDCQIVTSVQDGDTFYTNDGRAIRLAEIDAPELTQEYGYESKVFVESYVLGKEVKLIPVGKSYDRIVCEVFIGDIWLNKLIVDSGYAWAYKKYSKLNADEIKARNNHLGLWSNPNPIPPFKYRLDAKKN